MVLDVYFTHPMSAKLVTRLKLLSSAKRQPLRGNIKNPIPDLLPYSLMTGSEHHLALWIGHEGSLACFLAYKGMP